MSLEWQPKQMVPVARYRNSIVHTNSAHMALTREPLTFCSRHSVSFAARDHAALRHQCRAVLTSASCCTSKLAERRLKCNQSCSQASRQLWPDGHTSNGSIPRLNFFGPIELSDQRPLLVRVLAVGSGSAACLLDMAAPGLLHTPLSVLRPQSSRQGGCRVHDAEITEAESGCVYQQAGLATEPP